MILTITMRLKVISITMVMTVIRLGQSLLQGTCMFPVKGIFFLIPGKELSNGLIEIKNDLDLANCIAVGYKNGKVVDMFLEHHGFLKMDPVLGVSAWYSKKMWENAYSYFIRPVGGSAMWPNTLEEPPLPPVLRKMPGPSIADPTDSEVGDTGFMNKDETVIEDPIEESQIIEDAIATGKLKTAGLKRRCKSERIAKRAKPFQFGKDGAGSCADKAWDVDEVLAEE
ncbi:hypothetical protein Tco_0585668 [Tanacetum coccineum]